jgi:hypothetical protein
MDAVLRPPAEVSVLVEEEYVEEVVPALLRGQSNESHFFQIPHAIQSLVPHSPQSINGDISRSLADEYRSNLDVFHTVGFSKVVNQITRRQQI